MNEDTLTLELIKPVKIGSVEFARLELREPTAGEIAKAEEAAASNTRVAIALIAAVAGVPKTAIEMLCQRDYQRAADFFVRFAVEPETSE